MSMKADPINHRRRILRLPDYDYSTPGAYFVTTVAFKRHHLFASLESGETRLTRKGIIVHETWNDLVKHIQNIELDAYVIMPNHFHAIVWIKESDTNNGGQTPFLTEIVRQFKSFSARRINKEFGRTGNPIWQRSYYEHVIRNEADLSRIREYIASNPNKWMSDMYYSE